MNQIEKGIERVVKSNPIDRTARSVMQKGTRYEGFKLPNGAVHSEDPLPTRSLPPNLHSRIGEKMGRFTVVGFSRKSSAENIWIVRCSCGRYEPRSSSALNRRAKNSLLGEAMCLWCLHISRIRSKGLKAQSAPIARRQPPLGKKWCGNSGRCTNWIMDHQEMCFDCLPGQDRQKTPFQEVRSSA